MKTASSICLTFFTLQCLFGQLPEFQNNVSEEDIKKSIVLNEFGSKYEQIISFTSTSYWNKGNRAFFVLLLENGSWLFKKLSVRTNEDNSIKKAKTKKLKVASAEVEDFILLLNEVEFWTFKQGSLNLNKKKQGNGTTLVKSISDGSTDTFLLKNGSNIRVSYAYEADQLQEFIPTTEREKFIEVRNAFYKIIEQH